MDRLIAHPHLRCCHCFFPFPWDCRPRVTKRGRCPWLITREPAFGWCCGLQKRHLCGEPGGVEDPCPKTASQRGFFFVSLALLFSPLLPSLPAAINFHKRSRAASATKWAEDRALRDRCIPWSWSWCWRLGSMVIITPKSDPNTHLVTLSVWGSRYEGESPKQ